MIELKKIFKKIGGELLKVNIEHSPNLEAVENCGDYIGILLNGNSIENVNQKSEWIKRDSSLLVGWETDYYTTLPGDLNLKNLNFIRLGDKFYEVQMSRELDENDNPIYGIIEID